MKKITYSQVGDNYDTKDPVKKLVQSAAKKPPSIFKKQALKKYPIAEENRLLSGRREKS